MRASYLLLAFFVVGCAAKTPTLRVPTAAELAAQSLLHLLQENGKFLYQVRDDGSPMPERYNIVRHSGAIYALAQFDTRYPSDATKDALQRASHFLVTSSVREVKPGMRAVFSDPDLTGSGRELMASLGGSGLGLIGLLMAEKRVPGMSPPSLFSELGNFLLFMQKPDGRFFSQFFPGRGRSLKFHSLYYPGEAALALVLLFEQSHDERMRSAAERALGYLAKSRREKIRVPADNWALLATKELLRVSPEMKPDLREALLFHARQIVRVDLEGKVREGAKSGCFSSDGRTTPTATRLEGLFAALRFLPADDNLVEPIRSGAASGVAFLQRAQLINGPLAGAIPKSLGDAPSDHVIRIDYIQHALSAFLEAEEIP